MDGLLIINKPAGLTSHDVVARVRRILNERSVGHLGTLDPSATGVLPLVVGRFTRLAAFYNDADKRYEGVIHFGQATDTYDSEGEPIGPGRKTNFSLQQLREAAAKFAGTIQQTPPPFSAKKISGVPAYKMARKKQDVKLEPRQVDVKEFEIIDFDGQSARFKAWVGSGTYIRSLAHDLGEALGSGAHLGELARTAVREFRLEDAHALEDVAKAAGSVASGVTSEDVVETAGAVASGSMSDKKYYVNNAETQAASGLQGLFLHPRLILPEFPAVTAPPEALAKIRHGAAVNLPYFAPRGSASPVYVRVFADQTQLIAIARQIAGTLFHPKVVLM